MKSKRRICPRSLVGVVLVAGVVFSRLQLEKIKLPEFPPLGDMVFIDESTGLQDVTLVAAGFRSIAADLAWIQLLQYTGGVSVFDKDGQSGTFPHLKDFTFRVMRIDPYFVQAASFGAGLLAWLKTINRPEEAVDLLKEGIRYNPMHWPFHAFLIGIGYQKSDQVDKMLAALGNTIFSPDCPPLVKAILANTFKLNKRYADALVIWDVVYRTSDDPSFKNRAMQQISEIHALQGRPR